MVMQFFFETPPTMMIYTTAEEVNMFLEDIVTE